MHLLLALLGADISVYAAAQRRFATQASPLVLHVDASLAARGIAYVHEARSVRSLARLTLVYPKWIPGEHGPTGPLNNLTSIRVKANGKSLDWRRDTVDLYAFHVDVPDGVSSLDVTFTVLMDAPGDIMSTHNVTIINWNRYILYQAGIDSHEYYVKPSITVPSGWEFGTALRDPQRTGNVVTFAVTPLNMLIDSPLDMATIREEVDALARRRLVRRTRRICRAPARSRRSR